MAKLQLAPETSSRSRALARQFRKRPQGVEAQLWVVLRGRRLNDIKFRRQVPLGRYVVDFVCFRHRLIVEAGPWHDPDHDRMRDAWLQAQGFRVLRFPNALVHIRPHEVIATIVDAARPKAERRVNPSSGPLRGPPSPASKGRRTVNSNLASV
jgi:very-short-patch-repair endonuclease